MVHLLLLLEIHVLRYAIFLYEIRDNAMSLSEENANFGSLTFITFFGSASIFVYALLYEDILMLAIAFLSLALNNPPYQRCKKIHNTRLNQLYDSS